MVRETHKYDDIISLSRPVSSRHVPMSLLDRGAQFSPFAALVGYEAVIEETARLTDSGFELDESGKELLDRKLRILADPEHENKEAVFLCFVPDDRKEGGSYQSVSGTVKKVDLYRQSVLFSDGREIWIDQIRGIEGVDDDD